MDMFTINYGVTLNTCNVLSSQCRVEKIPSRGCTYDVCKRLMGSSDEH